MQLTGITFAEDSTTVELAVTNNSRNPIKLNDNQDMVLRDDLGNQYNLVPAPENPELVVQPGTYS
jgi:type 1 fimbria pilin